MNELRSLLSRLKNSPSISTLRSLDVGGVQWDTQEIAEVLFPFLSAAPNLEEFTLFDYNLNTMNHKNFPVFNSSRDLSDLN